MLHVMEKRRMLKQLKHRVIAKRLFVISFFSFLLFIALAYFFKNLRPDLVYIEQPFFWTGFASLLYVHYALCPNCKHKFSVDSYRNRINDFTTKCMTCGLKQNGENIEEAYENKDYESRDEAGPEGTSLAFKIIMVGVGFHALAPVAESLTGSNAFSQYAHTIGNVIVAFGVLFGMFKSANINRW